LELIQDDPVMGVWAHRLLAIAATEQGDWEEALKQWQHCAAYGPPTLRSDALEQIERIRARQR
jgi:cytochrome c-type biogenesis protein CcmH/NrfG